MEDFLEFLKSRRSIRKYKSKSISDKELDMILEAGVYAPSSGNRQYPELLLITDKTTISELGVINRKLFGPANSTDISKVSKEQPSIADSNSITNGFYNAPAVIAIFTPKEWIYSIHDACVAAENIMLMAWKMNIGSCFISRCEDTFLTDYGKSIQAKANIDPSFVARAIISLGYVDGLCPDVKPRKQNRIHKL